MLHNPALTHETALRLLADCARSRVKAIAGYDPLGCHLASAVCALSWPDNPVAALYTREPKAHGTKKSVEGPRLDIDAPVAVIITDLTELYEARQRLCDVGYRPVIGLFAEQKGGG